jgi:DNA-binding transcriptional regulator YiaG
VSIRGKKSSQNWEQGRRQPTGPAKEIATLHPKVLLEVA